MKLLEIVNGPWAIEPARLMEIRAIYATHLRGDKIDIPAVEQRLGRPLNNEPKPYEIIDGVAVLDVSGVIAKRANLFTQISGGVSTELVGRDLAMAMNDPVVHSIILHIDSPGGTVDGTQTLANQVRAARDVKPVVTLAGGMMASGGYWIGSAASEMYIEDLTTQVGSIGVVVGHKDVSKAEAAEGVKTTEITAGKYKRIASQYAPLTDEGRESLQGMVDHLYSVFVGAVAENRGVSTDKVLADMADGRVFVGQQAIDAGLVDGVSTLGDLIAQLNTNRTSAGAARISSTSPKGQVMPITREQLNAQDAALVASILAEGAAAERTRIISVESALIPGHEALIASMKFDGKSTGGDAALAVLGAERKLRSTAAADIAADAAQAGVIKPAAAPAVIAPKAEEAADEDTPVEERCKAKWDSDKSVRAEYTSLAAFTAYTRANEGGRIRVLRKAA